MPDRQNLNDRIAKALGIAVANIQPLGGGCVADVVRADLADGRTVAVKRADIGLDIEGNMLRDLAAAGLPVPAVVHNTPRLLIMEFIDGGGTIEPRVEEHAADLVAALHGHTSPQFGYAYDTVIGGLPQPNAMTDDWRTFFRDRRLLKMADDAYTAGRLPMSDRHRIETLAARLDQWVPDQVTPALLHGDLWGGNVVCKDGRVAAFIDPAVYVGDAEIELAFTTLFNTFGDRFFARYGEHRPIDPAFFEERKDLYNLYPLLVHVRLFGGSYVGAVRRTLERFGC